MSEDNRVDEFRQAPGTEPTSALEASVHVERRQRRREPPKSLEDAHAIVKSIANRRIENESWVRKWRLVERGVCLLALVGAYLLYYLVDKMNEAMSLPSLGF